LFLIFICIFKVAWALEKQPVIAISDICFYEFCYGTRINKVEQIMTKTFLDLVQLFEKLVPMAEKIFEDYRKKDTVPAV
jgi:hypothetical protein